MKLFVLFAQFPGYPPKAMHVTDEHAITRSGKAEDVFKREVLDTVRAAQKESAENWAWFEIVLPNDTITRISQTLLHETPSFQAKIAETPVQKDVRGHNSIKVTVGRTPGKIDDDEVEF